MASRRKSRRRPRRKPGAEQSSRGRGRRSAPTRDLAGAAAVARRRFRIQRLHPEQERAIQAVLDGRDALAVLPTGYGKSLIYQLPAVLTPRPTVVVSPLIALMVDQERSLRARGVPVVRLDGTLLVAERRAALERIAEGGSLVVLTTPETLESKATRPHVVAAKPWLLCVDEAHCISEWGHDFRPAYLRLGVERKALGDPVVLALTATATPRVQADVSKRLALSDPLVVTAPAHRPNLRLDVEIVTAADKPVRAGKLIRRLPRPTIVYCSTTIETDRIATALERRIPTARYHGKRTKAEREAAQKRFLKPKGKLVLVATSAFGMGIDKPDIRTIVHYQAPGSLEQYVQEAGRAGRDGRPSRCVLLYDPADLEIQRFLQDQGRADVADVRRLARALEAWAGEDRPVSIPDLAKSARLPQTRTRALCTELEELGALERDNQRRYLLVLTRRELASRVTQLARALHTKEKEDAARLEVLDAYARTTECRSRFIRTYFGEEDPPECGNCDICRLTGVAKPGGTKGRRRSRQGARGGKQQKSSQRRSPRRRGRRRRKKSGSD